jgi:PAS domain S-box-containing protein
LREKIETHEQKYRPVLLSGGFIQAGFVFGALYWILDSVRDLFISNNGTLFDRMIKPDPMEFWMRMLAVLVLFLFGIYAQSILNQRKKTEERLREEEERLYQIIKQMPYPITVCTSDGTAKMVNKAYLTMFGISSGNDFIGTYNIFEDPLFKRKGLINKIKKPFKGKKTYIPEIAITKDYNREGYRNITGDRLIMELTLSPVFRNGGDICQIICIWKNITYQKKIEQEKKKIQEQLLQAQKMEAVGILAGGIAHDFNNLLTAIIGSADMAMMQMKSNDFPYPDLKEIKSAAARAADLTRQLLLFSRKHIMKFSPLNLNDCITGLLNMIERLIGEDIQVTTHLKSDLWGIKADRTGIQQIIMNLVVNAKDALPDGGKITIMTENIILKASDRQDIERTRSGKFICLSIADTGYGMDDKTLQHIFEPFFTTKKPGCGSGLGLSVAYGIIQRHGGWIDVFSKKELGTMFRIYLPVSGAIPEKNAAEKDSPARTYQGKGERLLIVEDDENVRNFTISALRKSGYDVISAKTAKEALELFEGENRNFDMVLSDVVLPDRSGVELIEQLNTLKPRMGILLGSGYIDHKAQRDNIEAKGYRFMQKPYTLADLLRAIREVIAHSGQNQ